MKSSVEFTVIRILSFAWDKEMQYFLHVHYDLSVYIPKETACVKICIINLPWFTYFKLVL